MRIITHLKNRLFAICVIVAATAMRLMCASNEALAQGWVLEIADPSANSVGYFSSIALDASGNPHVSYQDGTAGALKYGRKSGGVWTTETADGSANDVGAYSSLALDASGNPRVSYKDNTTDDLKYARKLAGVWTIETADGSASDVGSKTSLALDASGNPHVSYYDATNTRLKYAWKSGGVWTTEITQLSLNVYGYYSSLALDVSGNPHVSYLDATTGDLRYARKSAGVWTTETADGSANDVGSYSSLALDASGNPHVTYWDITAGDLKYARKSGGVWTIETAVGSTNSSSFETSLALDAFGNPHVIYWYGAFTTNDLKYARKSGGAWTVETADASLVLDDMSLALDAAGNPHVSYRDDATDDLKYAYIPSLIVGAPGSGITWAVGSSQTISWSYTGGLAVDISDVFLSVDGGRTFDMIRDNTRDFSATIRVPHAPTRYAQIKIVQPSPFVVGYSDSFFTIDATITLAKFEARAGEIAGSTALSWETTPGREADVRYRIERSVSPDAPDGGSSGDFLPIHPGLLDRNDYLDASVSTAARYRLIAVNGLGEEYALGETAVAAALGGGRRLAIHPNPAIGGDMGIVFRVPYDPDFGSSGAAIDLAIFDVSGRQVRTLASGTFPTGVRTLRWDGRDDAGRDVGAGAYFLRLSGPAGVSASERVVVVR